MPRDHYDVLGVARDADEPAIRRAYRRLARAHHPDLNQTDPAAEARFKELTGAFEVLGDREKRAAYDAFPGDLGGAVAPSPAPPSHAAARPRTNPWPPARSRSPYEERLREPPWHRPPSSSWSAPEEPRRVRDRGTYEYDLGYAHGWASRSDAELQREVERLASHAPTASDYSGRAPYPRTRYAEGFEAGGNARLTLEFGRALGLAPHLAPSPSDWRAWAFDPVEERRRRGDGTGGGGG